MVKAIGGAGDQRERIPQFRSELPDPLSQTHTHKSLLGSRRRFQPYQSPKPACARVFTLSRARKQATIFYTRMTTLNRQPCHLKQMIN